MHEYDIIIQIIKVWAINFFISNFLNNSFYKNHSLKILIKIINKIAFEAWIKTSFLTKYTYK